MTAPAAGGFALVHPTAETFVSAKEERRAVKLARKREWLVAMDLSARRWDAFKARAFGICREEDERTPLLALDGTRLDVRINWSPGRYLQVGTVHFGYMERHFKRIVGEAATRRYARALLADLAGSYRRWDWELRVALDALRDAVPVCWGLLSETRVAAVDAFQQLASAGYICECATGQFGDLPLGGLATRWLRGIESGEFDEATVLTLGGRLMRAVCELEAIDEDEEDVPF